MSGLRRYVQITQIQFFSNGELTFLEAHKKTGRILNISVVSYEGGGQAKVLNYITAPNVLISSAIVASSALPFIIPPVRLLYKVNGTVKPYDAGGKFWRDGSYMTDIPEKTLHQLFHVRFTIVSQANPHIQCFFYNARGSAGNPTQHRSGLGYRGGFIVSSLVQFLRLDLQKWVVSFDASYRSFVTCVYCRVSVAWIRHTFSFSDSKVI
jgi:predicted acylesterase/phospholipase RssA